MKANLVPSDALTALLRDAFVTIADFTDVAPTVSLIEGDFDPHVGATWPALSAAFAALVATDVWEIQHDALSGKDFFVAPDPDGGWDFVATAAGVTITGFKVTGIAAGDHVFAAKFLNPIPVTAIGQHITLPYVAAEATTMVLDGENPYEME